jgi:hypothetical protein
LDGDPTKNSLVPAMPVSKWRQRIGGLLYLVTGAGLIVHIVFGLPLWLTVCGGLVIVCTALYWLGALKIPDLRLRVLIGVSVGALATLGYDLSRLAVVRLFSLDIDPFGAWRHFGAGFIGASTPTEIQFLVGATFHLLNGVAFAVAYTYWFAQKGPLAGIAFALSLEAFMLSLYPGWLHITAYGPLIVMSLTGHLFYGAILGHLARLWWGRTERA